MTLDDPREKIKRLTKREIEVLKLFCQGMLQKEMAYELGLKIGGIKSRMRNIHQKLELDHLSTQERIGILYTTYCELLSENILHDNTEEEDEEPEPVSPEVGRMVEEDENAFMHLNSPEITEDEVIEASPRRRRGCVWALVGIIVGVGLIAGLFFALGGNIPGISASEPPPAPTEEPVSSPEILAASDTPVVIVVTATQLPASETPIPTDTPLPTLTSTDEPTSTPTTIPTSTPTTIPSPRLEPTPSGPIIETGDWYKEDNVWVRLVDYKIHFTLIHLNFEIWNKSDRALYFSWSPEQNFSMIDNKNNRYEVYTLDPRKATVEINERLIILGGTHTSLLSTVQFDKDPLYNPGVTDLFVTMEYFSEIDKATFHINVGQ